MWFVAHTVNPALLSFPAHAASCASHSRTNPPKSCRAGSVFASRLFCTNRYRKSLRARSASSGCSWSQSASASLGVFSSGSALIAAKSASNSDRGAANMGYSPGVSSLTRGELSVNLGLTDRVALVVGGASGLGSAIAKAFADEGCRVGVWDVSPSVSAAAAGIGATGWRVDVTDANAVAAAAGETWAHFGAVHHLVFAVGIGSGKFGFPFWQLDPSDWDRVLRVNLVGAAIVAHALAPKLADQRAGTVLFLASVAGQIGSQTDPPYSASKAGLINFAQCAAKDLAPFGVRVNTLCPGMIKTPLNRSVWQSWHDRQPPEQRVDYEAWAAEKIAKLVPLNRWQTPEDVAAMAVFLASDRAANVTGQTINVDGGYVMHW